jgi:hypothetical protein
MRSLFRFNALLSRCRQPRWIDQGKDKQNKQTFSYMQHGLHKNPSIRQGIDSYTLFIIKWQLDIVDFRLNFYM